MFESARIKLTIWYVLITLVVSVFFSIALYAGIIREIDRIAHVRIPRPYINTQTGEVVQLPPRAPLEAAEVNELKNRIRLNLLTINAVILALSGVAGYFLAGRTLRPIQSMMDDQRRFIADASHELRTPLTALRTSIEVNLRDKKLTLAEARTLLVSNLEEVGDLQILSDSLIRLAQYEQPPTTAHKRVSIHSIIAEAVRKVTPLAKRTHITIESIVPDLEILGDPLSLGELFVILLDNAIKYSPSHSVVHIEASHHDSVITIAVADHGIGIAKTDIAHVFERFYRVDKSRSKREVSGYGLGLSIARKIVDDHKGTIHVESAVGKGSTFTVTLPYKHTA